MRRSPATLALLALLIALAAAAGTAAAQTGGEADTLEGRIIARIQDRTSDDGVDDYRIEFGFLPQWAMDDKDPWSEAASTFADWLPTSRYLTKARIDERAAADNRGWLRSSLITVPASAITAQSEEDGAGLETDGGGDANLVSGRVIARYQPNSAGALRIRVRLPARMGLRGDREHRRSRAALRRGSAAPRALHQRLDAYRAA